MYACMYVCMYVNICICICMYAYTYAYAYAYVVCVVCGVCLCRTVCTACSWAYSSIWLAHSLTCGSELAKERAGQRESPADACRVGAVCMYVRLGMFLHAAEYFSVVH